MSREEEYKQKCRQVKDYYLEEICEHEDAGCLGDAENARKWRRAELEELDRQYRVAVVGGVRGASDGVPFFMERLCRNVVCYIGRMPH